MKTEYQSLQWYVYNKHYSNVLQQEVHNLLLTHALMYPNTNYNVFYYTYFIMPGKVTIIRDTFSPVLSIKTANSSQCPLQLVSTEISLGKSIKIPFLCVTYQSHNLNQFIFSCKLLLNENVQFG